MLLDGYVRVSRVGDREGESFISPSVQREQIEFWAASNHAGLGEVFEELDESGGRTDRPLLLKAIERIENGQSSGLIVAKLDRFGRSLIDGLSAITRIEHAGGTFVSVQDGLDIATPTGKLVLQILLSIGEWELRRARSNWETAKQRAIRRGVYVGREPIGYLRGPNGRLTIDPQRARMIRMIFDRRYEGDSYAQIARLVNGQGHRTSAGFPFSASSVFKIIKNPAYCGEAHNGPYRNPEAHKPIVDRSTWLACQARPRKPKDENEALLAGIIRCAGCGRAMPALRSEGEASKFLVYRCYEDRNGCPAPAYARGDELDPLVEEFLFTRGAESHVDEAATALVETRERRLNAADSELVAYRDQPAIASALEPKAFADGLAYRQELVERRHLELADARRAVSRPTIDLAELEKHWGSLSWPERRTALSNVVGAVFVEHGSGPIIKRAWVFRPGQAPATTRRGRSIHSFEFELEHALRLRNHRFWPIGRFRPMLEAFMAARSPEWPGHLEFSRAGAGRLYAQTFRQGGPHFWGQQLGFSVPYGAVRWTPAVVRDALRPFLRGLDTWPGKGAFRDAGLIPVYDAARYHGGIAYWAWEFGLSAKLRNKPLWSAEKIEADLRAFVVGQERFPSKRHFDECGQSRLYAALCRDKGVAYWAERVKLPRSSQVA